MKFTAVAFDLDGTLYPEYRLYLRLIPFLLKDLRLLLAMGKARDRLRNLGGYEGDFYKLQGQIMAEILCEPAEKVIERTERLIYRGWEDHFKKITLFHHVRETLETFRKRGIKMGLLSDFPPDTKLKNLKIDDYWDTVVCSEISGRLKPDPMPFLDLAGRMKTPPEDILYVGNSASYDAAGARKAGMKTALIRPKWKRPFSAKAGGARQAGGGSKATGADFIFSDYRQLCDYVLS